MKKTRNIVATVDSMVRKLDPKVIVRRAFHDDVSGRVFVLLVKGPREHEFAVLERDFNDGNIEKVGRAIQVGVERLQHQPTG